MQMNIAPQVKQVIYYGLGLIATKLISLIVLPIMTHLIDPAQYGDLEILLTFINLVTIILGFGLTEALFRFGGTAKTARFISIVCANATTLALIIGVVICSPIILFATTIKTLLPGSITTAQVIYLGLALIPCNALAVQLDWLRLKGEATQFVVISFCRSLLQALLVLLALYAGFGVTGIMFVTAFTTIFMLVYFLLFQLDAPLQFNKSLQKKLFFYGLPLSFNGIAEFVFMSLSTWWLAYVVGAAAMAPFALAMKFAAIAGFIIYPFYMWWGPERFKHLETEAAQKYTAYWAEIGVVISFFGAYLVTIGGSLIILWLIPVAYHEGIDYLPIASFMLASKYAADIMSTGLFLEKPNYVMGINTAVAILTVIGFYFCIPIWHVWGTLFVLLTALLLRWIAYVYLSQQQFYLPYRYFRIIIFISASLVLGIVINELENGLFYIVGGGLGSLFLLGLAYSLDLLPPLKYLIVRPKKSKALSGKE